MNDFSPWNLNECHHAALVLLDAAGKHRAVVLDLAPHAEHERALVFLDPWNDIPAFAFAYITDDLAIKGEIEQHVWPGMCDLAEVIGFELGRASPGTIFRSGTHCFLWVVHPYGSLFPLAINSDFHDDAPGFRQYDWWLLGNDFEGTFVPATLVEASAADVRPYNLDVDVDKDVDVDEENSQI